MTDVSPNLLGIVLGLGALGLAPFLIVTMTAFLKISVVMFLIRNALGVQQTPPNLVLYGIAMVLTVYVTTPLAGDIYARVTARPVDFNSIESIKATATAIRQPVQAHLLRFTQLPE